MNGKDTNDIELMMLADGKLTEQEARELHARIGNDPDLAVRYAAFVETRTLLEPQGDTVSEAHVGTESDDKVAIAIRAMAQMLEAKSESDQHPPRRSALTVIEGNASVSQDQPSQTKTRVSPTWRLPLAATLAFAIGGLAGYLLHTGIGRQQASSSIDLLASRPGLNQALQTALSSAASGADVAWSDPTTGGSGRIHVLSSHRLNDGTLCREYEISFANASQGRILAAGCRRDGHWDAEVAIVLPDAGNGYAPASGDNIVERHLEERGSTGPLTPEDEKALIGGGWSALK